MKKVGAGGRICPGTKLIVFIDTPGTLNNLACLNGGLRMVRSMTGYGRGESIGPAGRLVVEGRAVNHRFSEVAVRLPRQLAALEERVRKAVQSRVARGRVDVFVQWEQNGSGQRSVQVDKELALAYHNALKELEDVFGSKIEITAEGLARLSDVLTVQETQVEPDAVWPTLFEGLEGALSALVAMREREGQTLAVDLLERLSRIENWVNQVAERSPQAVEDYRQRLLRRLDELLPGNAVDPNRIAQEVVIFADRSDVTEEIKRIHSHISQFRSELTGVDGGDDPGAARGRKLDFLVQELNREINTIGAKAQDAAITGIVVEVKAELEKIREQVQNIE